VIEKRNIQDVFMIKNVLLKKKTYMETPNVDVRDSSRKIIDLQRISRKHGLVQIVGDFY